jgi:post-segregation antitoxin (ccd killing protein)
MVLDAEKKKKWLADNLEAIVEYNKLVAKSGLFSDGRR